MARVDSFKRLDAGSLLLAAGVTLLLATAPAIAQDQQPPPPAPYIPQSAPDDSDPDQAGTLFPETDPDVAAPGQPRETPQQAGVRPRPAREPVPRPQPRPEPEVVTAIERQPRVDALDPTETGRIERENGRIEAIEGKDIADEADPFAPLGLRLGTFTYRPTLEQGVTWTSNAFNSPTPEAAFLSETTLRLNAVSDWSRHGAVINAYGTYRRTLDGAKVDEPSFGIDGTLNLDIREDLRGIIRAGYALRPEAADSPVVLPPDVSRPLLHTLTGSVGLEKDVGKLRFAATGNVENQSYDDANIGGGGTLSQQERNSTLYTATLRTGYAVSPALMPFAEVEVGRRDYQLELDAAGYARSSDRVGVRAGIAIDRGEKLTGEVAAGWISESFDDARLATISGLALQSNLRWSPYRGTIVAFDASSTVEGTTTAGESGSILHSFNLRFERELRRNLTMTASAGASYRDYASSPDHDLTLRGETSLTWWLNRYAGLTGRYRFEQLDSTLPNRDATTHSVYLGVTLRR